MSRRMVKPININIGLTYFFKLSCFNVLSKSAGYPSKVKAGADTVSQP